MSKVLLHIGLILLIVTALAAGCTAAQPTTTPTFTPTPTATPTPAQTLLLTPGPTLTPTPGPPTIAIIYPAPGSYEIISNVVITVRVSGFNLVDRIGQANVPGEGHIIYYADVQPPTGPGVAALTAPGTYVISSSTSYTWPEDVIGKHTFCVQLVNNDNTPLSPQVTAQVAMNVNS